MSQTGEPSNPNGQPIGGGSSFDWKAVTAAVGLAFAAGTAHWRSSSAEKTNEKLEGRIERLETRANSNDVAQERVANRLDTIGTSLKNIEASVSLLTQRAVVRAGGPGR